MPRSFHRLAAKFAVPAILASAAVAAATSVQSQPLTIHTVSAAQAMEIIDAAIASCSAPGPLVTVTVAVVDHAGILKMELVADTASPHNLDLARRKAYTARTYRRPSLMWAQQTAGESETAGQRQMVDVIPLGGGVPIMMGDEAIGGVGVSGAMGGQPADEACAMAGVAAIADELQ